ncbi:MAG TPA: pirin family protein [Steroidobacteraceae bacterium]|nr:pirin family protein [Steroidobacteraceae bacterium]
MSVLPDIEPASAPCPGTPQLAGVIDARARDLGGFTVGRVLPSSARKLIGPFIFFDHMGPAAFPPGRGIDVRPHPHIGLATVTYLFEGEIVHRDSLGSHQPIRPGDVNWMTAGRGIAHSERTSAELRQTGSRLDGLQLWVALPRSHEETGPEFHHHPGRDLPAFAVAAARVRLLAGSAYGRTSPVRTFSPLFYLDAVLPPDSELPLPDEHEERAAYVVSGTVLCGNERAERGRMLVFTPGASATLRAVNDARVALIGGAPIDGDRHIFWNFVSSSQARIEQAKRDWRAGRFAKVPGDEQEFIPLPE